MNRGVYVVTESDEHYLGTVGEILEVSYVSPAALHENGVDYSASKILYEVIQNVISDIVYETEETESATFKIELR